MNVSAWIDAFVARWKDHSANPDQDPYGAQCVELVNEACKELGIEEFGGNAADFVGDPHPDCDWIANNPTNAPKKGDFLVWGAWAGNPYGHTDIAIDDWDPTTGGHSLAQNWIGSNSTKGSPAAIVAHSWNPPLAGWYRPKLYAGGTINVSTWNGSYPMPDPPPPGTTVALRLTGKVDRKDAGVGTDRAKFYDAVDGADQGDLPPDGTSLQCWQAGYDGTNWFDRVVDHFDADGTPHGDWWMLDSFLNDGGVNPVVKWNQENLPAPVVLEWKKNLRPHAAHFILNSPVAVVNMESGQADTAATARVLDVAFETTVAGVEYWVPQSSVDSGTPLGLRKTEVAAALTPPVVAPVDDDSAYATKDDLTNLIERVKRLEDWRDRIKQA